MTKFALTTKYSSYNFGAMLQTYALQRTIKSLGAECFVVDADRHKRPCELKSGSVGQIVKDAFYKLHKTELDRGYERFEQFLEEYDKTKKYAHYGELKKDPPNADIYLSGSDQVWNPLNIRDNFFLRYAPKGAVRASYAASLGIPYMPKGAEKIFSEYVSDFDYISVRERDAKENVEKLTGKKVEVHVDPVLLMDKNEWDEVAVKPDFNKPYILCYILYCPDWINDWLKKLHKATGKEIVVVSFDAYRRIYHTKMVRDAGPKEMLGWIKNADFVISSSFHGAALSIANQKDFYAVVNPDSPSRLASLLDTFELSNRIINKGSDPKLNSIDYAPVEKIRLCERERSFEYLKFLISKPTKVSAEQQKDKPLKGTVEIIGDKCTACTVCREICPVSAIDYEQTAEGFKYPVIDKDKCINCSKCLKYCHAVNPNPLTKESCDAYFGWQKNEAVRAESTSGGAFTALADLVTENKGLVIGAYFNADKKKVMHGSSDEVSIKKFRKSKYVESDMANSLSEIAKALKEDRYVLFCGTPCQCAGVRAMFRDNERLILCDFFCHGVPSPKVFKDFLEQKEQKAKDKITDYAFRTKDYGWSQYGMTTEFDSGKTEKTVGRCEFFYTSAMLDNLFLRRSCYTCDKNVSHAADFTIGDFWGINKLNPSLNDNKGISILIANTDKARALMEKLKGSMELKDLDKHYIEYAFKVKTDDKKLDRRNKLFEEYNTIGISNFINKYYKKRLLLSRAVFALRKKQFKGGRK